MTANQEVCASAARQRTVHYRVGDERRAMIVGARMGCRSDEIERFRVIRQNVIGQRLDRVFAAARLLDDRVL